MAKASTQPGVTLQVMPFAAGANAALEGDFVILAFPSNQFGSQEPGTEAEIETFCTRNFGVTFPVFSKIDVNGSGAHPLYTFLKSSVPGLFYTEFIKWNFTKFLVDQNGVPVKRYGPGDTPEAIDKDVAELLGKTPNK